MEKPYRPKRIKPCENCRAHRRKCVTFDKTTCDRCHKLELTCIFKLTEKTTKTLQPVVSILKRNKLFDAIWTLKKESDSIQVQLSQLQSFLEPSPPICECKEPCSHIRLLPGQSNSRWGVTMTSNRRGIVHFQTTVQSLSDLSKFVTEAISFLHLNGYVERLSERNGSQILNVTYKTLRVEALIRNLISNEKQNNPTLNIISINSNQKRKLKRQVIETFFECTSLCDPVLIQSYYYPLLMQDPDSLLATTIVAKLVYSKCQHIDMDGYDFTRAEFARYCRMEAKSLLQEVLFDSEPTLDLCISLWALCFCSMYAMEPKEARFQSSICWRMMIQLKPLYTKLKYPTAQETIKAESWKRLFYLARYTEFNFHMAYDLGKDFSSIAHHQEVGLPSILPCEANNPRFITSVQCYRYVSQLTTNAAGITTDNIAEITGLRLFAGVIDRVHCSTIQYQENTLLHMWNNVPDNLRLGSGPFKITETNWINECTNPCVFRFNMVFYIYWMNLHSRLMTAPHKTDLTGSTFSRFDSDRSLIIASICSDTATKIFAAIACKFPCVMEVHWLAMSIEVLTLLTTAMNTFIRNRAIFNLQLLTHVLNLQLNAFGNENSKPSSPYLDRIKEMLITHTWL